MSKKDLSHFVRFGGLHLKKQKGYQKTLGSFHAPPAPKGFYAFPYIAQEMFLVGSMDAFQPEQWPKKPKDADENYDWDKLRKKEKQVRRNMRKEFKKTAGNIWHHLIEHTESKEIIDQHGSWVKTSINAWKKAFSKCSLNNRYGEKGSGWDSSVSSINEARGLSGYFSKDHYEVFFDEKV